MQSQQYLKQLATNSYSSKEEAVDMLVGLAEGYWHHNETLKLQTFKDEELQKAAYVLELLRGFSPHQDKARYQEATKELEAASDRLVHLESVTFYKFDALPKFNFDDVAKKWGLARGAAPSKLKAFLDLQRRSYSPDKNQASLG